MIKFQGFEAPNYTQIPNYFLDDLIKDLTTVYEVKVMLIIFRCTFGWKKGHQKDKNKLSMLDIMKIGGLGDKKTLSKTIKNLLEQNLIEREKVGQTFRYFVNIEAKNYVHKPQKKKVKKSILGGETLPQLGGETLPQLGGETLPVKPTFTQEKSSSKERKERKESYCSKEQQPETSSEKCAPSAVVVFSDLKEFGSLPLKEAQLKKLVNHYQDTYSKEDFENAALAYKQYVSKGRKHTPMAVITSMLLEKATPNHDEKAERAKEMESREKLVQERRAWSMGIQKHHGLKSNIFAVSDTMVMCIHPESRAQYPIGYLDSGFKERIRSFLFKLGIEI